MSLMKTQRLTASLLLWAFALAPVPAAAQAGRWDSLLSDSHWYVPVPQLLAYGSSSTSFARPFPMGDQTTWSFGTAENGVFTGTTTASLAIGSVVSTSDSVVQGIVTESGQARMVFTQVGQDKSTIGIGQVRLRDGVFALEMQMITGSDGLLVTHWAYMLPYNPANFTPPPATTIPVSLSAPQWKWTAGTRWRIVSETVFGTTVPGKLIITNYKNGYFWGQGIGPGPESQPFTFLGSITPEGNVLFSVLDEGSLSELNGQLLGDPSAAEMVLRSYLVSETANAALIRLVRPYVQAVTEAGDTSATQAAEVLYQLAGTETGLDGAMAPVFDAFDQLAGAALSDAITQTLPLFVGAGPRATYDTQRIVQQSVLDRIDTVQGLSTGDPLQPEAELWIKPFGNRLSQDSRDDLPGYDISGGGLILGFDRRVSTTTTLGGMLAYASNQITGKDDAATDALTLNSVQFGIYGTTWLDPSTELNGQIDGAVTGNSGLRTIDFLPASATSDYDSRTGHIGIGLRRIIPATPDRLMIPSLRIDYARVDTDAYTESGAGSLDLTVGAQSYEELRLTAGIRGDVRMTDRLRLSVDGAAGYNVLDTQTQITATYEGGGDSFVSAGEDVSPWLFSLGIGIISITQGGTDVALRYDLQASPTGYLSQTASVRFTLTF